MEIKIHRAGLLTTLQDLGRTKNRADGVPIGGATDSFAARVANALVGNPVGAALLELTLVGSELEFSADTVVALGGADFAGVPSWRPIHIRSGERLAIGPAHRGCRGYLAIAGGFETKSVLGSGGTYLAGGFGGFEGRALREGDILRAPPLARRVIGGWQIAARFLPTYTTPPTVRVIAGSAESDFEPGWGAGSFTVTPRSDRMGVRLSGAAWVRHGAKELLSAPVVPGTIQVPPDGQPIVLLADAQTLDGYPQIAHVITVDLPLVAQWRSGDEVSFEITTLSHAHELTLAREKAFAMLREGLAQKMRPV